MNLYDTVKREMNEADLKMAIIQSNAESSMKTTLLKVTTLLNDLGVKNELIFDEHFKELSISLHKEIDSPYFKSRIRIHPNEKITYHCGHYTVGSWNCNEVSSKESEVHFIGYLPELIKKDIEKTMPFVGYFDRSCN